MTIKRTAETKSRILRRPEHKTKVLPTGYEEHVLTLLGTESPLGYLHRWEPEDLTVVDPDTLRFRRKYKGVDSVTGEATTIEQVETVTGPAINDEMRRSHMMSLDSKEPLRINIIWEPTLPPQARR